VNARIGQAIAVIPVHNEAATIGAIVLATRAYLPVLVVDDASDDGSGQRATEAGAVVLTLARHSGKGAALRHGFAEALRRGAAWVMTLDGDGQHDPADIPRFLDACQRWPRHLIVGNRLGCPAAIPWARLHAIQVASFWINWIGQCQVQDTQSGLRLYPAALLRALRVRQEGFVFESALLLRAARAGWGIQEIPIRAVYIPGRTSQYRPLHDGTHVTAYLLARGLSFWPVCLGRLWRAWRQDHAISLQHRWRHARVAALATLMLPLLGLLALASLAGWRLGQHWRAAMIQRVYNPCLLTSRHDTTQHAPLSPAALPGAQVPWKGTV